MPPARIAAIAVSLLLTPLASGCALFQGDSERPIVSTAGMPGALEPIHAAAFTNDLVVFRVSSNGCTEREDITPIVTRMAREDTVITLRRITEDECTAWARDGVEMIWSFEELGLEPGELVEVNNPYFISDPDPAPES